MGRHARLAGLVLIAMELAPVILIRAVPNVLLVNPAVPAASVRELVALAKSKPGQLTFASSGNGTTGHLAGEMFKLQAGIDVLHIPYRGSPPALTDLLGGRGAGRAPGGQ